MRFVELTIGNTMAGRKIQTLLAGELGCSGTLIKRLKQKPGSVLLNHMPPARLTQTVAEGDLLRVDVDDDIPLKPSGNCPIPILYEDEDILILHKPAGMAVHPSGLTPLEGTVCEMLRGYLGGRPLHPVNRLDRSTSGAMTVAKSSYAHELLRKHHHSTRFIREYRAVVRGEGIPARGIIDLPIARAPDSAMRRQVSAQGAASRTLFETLETGNGLALLQVMPQTGRTHQIRVHLAAIGFPLAGDWLYGEENPDLIPRPALHACRICVHSPVSGEMVDVTAPLPPDMKTLCEKMRL